jgi:hypothetical protein
MQRMQDLMAIMPQLMRLQRTFELGQSRMCDWAQRPPQDGAPK